MKRNAYIFLLLAGMTCFILAVIYQYGGAVLPVGLQTPAIAPYVIPGLFVLGFALIFTGIYAAQRVVRSLASRNREMAGEIANLHSQNTFFLEQIPLMRSNIESLSTMREISRAINIHVEFEKILEEVLRIIGQMTNASLLDIFLSQTADGAEQLPLKAHFTSRGEHGYFYVYFSSDPEEMDFETIELGDFRSYSGDNYSVMDTTLINRGLAAGTAKVFTRSGSHDEKNMKLFIREKINAFEISKDDTGRAIQVKNVIRVQEGRTLLFAAPLIAEQEVLGVIRMSIEHMLPGLNPELIENMLRESCKHISLAIKKAQLYERAVKDGMTNLYNKPHFYNQLNLAIAQARGSEKRFCLMMIDIDHFKKVNDTYGHLTGDIILIGVATILRRNLREHDMAFRYGGEELAILMDDTGIRTASKAANRIRKTVKEKVFTGAGGEAVSVTVSIGLSQFYPDVMADADNLIGRADQALYRAKESGRDRVIAANKPRGVTTAEED